MTPSSWRRFLIVTAVAAGTLSGALAQEEVDLAELIVARDTYREAGDLQAAQTAAIQVVRRIEAEQGEDAATLAEPLLVLARIHRGLGNATQAEITLKRVIDIVRAEQSGTGPDLITPYQELARTFIEERRFSDALATLEEARSISRRNFGLFNMGQTQLFDDLTETYLGLDETAKAQQLQEEKVNLAVRAYGPNDPQVAPYREQLADYYQRSRLKVAAREEHRKALQIYAAQTPADTSAQLRALSNIMRLNFVLLGDEDEHVRIAQLLEDEAFSTSERAAAYVLLGDFYFVRVKDQNQAERYWAQAYRLSRDLPPEDARQLAFNKPAMLDFVPPLNAVDQRTSRRKRVAWGTMVAEFAVDANGQATDISVNMDPPDSRLETRYQQRIAAAHFRPRLVDSVPAPTAKVRLKHAYRYFVD